MNFEWLTTPELIASFKDNLFTADQQALEICVREDGPKDLVAFFQDQEWRPKDISAFIRRAKALKIPDKVTAAAIGKSANAVEHQRRRDRLSEMSDDPPNGGSTSEEEPDMSNVITLPTRTRDDDEEFAEYEGCPVSTFTAKKKNLKALLGHYREGAKLQAYSREQAHELAKELHSAATYIERKYK